MRQPGGRKAAIGAAMVLVSACHPEASDPNGPRCAIPEILTSTVAANADNVLSALISTRVRSTDSVAVRFGLRNAVLDSLTPAVSVTADTTLVPVLGLLPETDYAVQAVGYNACASTAGELLSFRTGPLPSDLPSYAAGGADPTPGFVAFAAGAYGLAIDNTGRVVWYHRFVNGPGLNFQAQRTGRYVARPPTAAGETGMWIEVDQLGAVRRTFGCARGLQPRFHDLIALTDGSYWMMCDEVRSMDLSAFGGVANAQVTGTAVQHIKGDGTLLFDWSPFDHFQITDLDPADRAGANVNWTHGNAIDLDGDGNLIVSFRSLNEIAKIDAGTGAVMWRMGGRAGQFAFQGTEMPAFARQHGVRVLASGELLVLDNLSNPRESRAKRVSFDADADVPTARLVASYGSQPPVVALLGGSTQELPNGHALVAFGNGGRVEEYDAAGSVVWRIEGSPGYVFRAQRIHSLYAPGVGLGR